MKDSILRRHICVSKVALLVLSAISSSFLIEKKALGNDSVKREMAEDPQNKSQPDFDPAFLNGGTARHIDLNRFAHGAAVAPGNYQSEIYVNDINIGSGDVLFKENKDNGAIPYLSSAILTRTGINLDKLSSDVINKLKKDEYISLKEISPQMSYQFDSGEQRLDISIPQVLIQNTRGYVNPELWENGVTAAMLGYNANYYTAQSHGQKTDSAYIGINSGINILGWNFRHNGSYNWQEQTPSKYSSINTYAQHDIVALKGRLTVGEYSSNGQVFDSLPYRGVELQDDERMLPSSLRGYAPEIRGIAKTNAKVTVSQNNLKIYETTVSPGAFAISDIYPSGYGSNLQVTVTEADGSTQSFEVPYAAVSQLLRPGAQHYDVIVGRYNDQSISESPLFYQATYQRGLTSLLTAYGGGQFSEDYLALQAGAALNTMLGALAIDVTQANTKFDPALPNEPDSSSGQSYRISFNKYIAATDSNFAIAAYRFSTEGYLDFRNAMLTQDALKHGESESVVYRPRSRLSVTANQGLPSGWGQLFISGYVQDYWNSDSKSDLQYQAGYNNVWKTVTLGFNASRTRNGNGDMETSFMLTFSMPLGGAMAAPQFSGSFTRDGQGNTGEQVGLSGSLGKDNQYSYGISATDYSNTRSSINLNGQYLSPVTRLSANIGASSDYTNTSVGLTGSLLGYSGGLVFTPYVSDTFAIVEAKGAAGANISSFPGITVDRWGHAAIPYLNPYQINEIALDPKGMSDDAELQSSSQTVIPQAGAIVKVSYKVQQGYPILINATQSDGSSLPFGAAVFNKADENIGIVGQGGQIYARVDKEKDTLRVKWGDTKAASCHISYMIPAFESERVRKTFTRFNSTCQ